MPPKVRFTETDILDAAIEIIRDKGISGVNARDLAKSLRCSAQPIFRCFQSMDNLKRHLYHKAEQMYNDCIQHGMESHRSPFLGMGLAYIGFAKNEKNLFKFLFMSDEFKGKSILDMMRDDENQEIVRMLSGMTGLDADQAEQLFLSIWLTTHGIASMLATNDCDFSEEQIVRLLTDLFSGVKYQLCRRGRRDE